MVDLSEMLDQELFTHLFGSGGCKIVGGGGESIQVLTEEEEPDGEMGKEIDFASRIALESLKKELQKRKNS